MPSKLSRIAIVLVALVSACGDDDAPVPDSGTDEPDAGDRCSVRPLAEFCGRPGGCPSSPEDLRRNQCDLRNNTFIMDNACGGKSVYKGDGLGGTQWNFDAKGELIGAGVSSDIPRRCPIVDGGDGFTIYFGRVCETTGTREPHCVQACPGIACRDGAEILADFPFTFQEAKAMELIGCRNDECFTGKLGPAATEPAPGSGVGITVPDGAQRDEDMSGLLTVSFMGATGGGVYLQVEWIPWSQEDLRDGDHYRLTGKSGGDTFVLIDTDVEYENSSLGSGECLQMCKFKELDLRGMGPDSDAGIDDDAGR